MAVSPYVNRAELWLANASFRPSFRLPEHFHPSIFLKWFPGHMAKGFRKMQLKLPKCDCVVEVHDARIPFTGRNPKFQNNLSSRPHVLVLNKMDLIGMAKQREILRQLESEGTRAVLTDSKSQYHYSIKRVVPAILEAVKDAEYEGTYIRSNPDKPYNILTCGLPNTGKSSLINALRRKYLRKGKATRVGAVPGITRSMQEKIKVCDEPVTYMIDTPGVVAPYIPTAEIGMKLALIGCFKDHIVGEELIADYLLYILNKEKRFEYVESFGLRNPSDNVNFVMRQWAKKLNATISGGVPDYRRAHVDFLKRFRTGMLGHILLDRQLLREKQKNFLPTSFGQ
ncbi:mitochondrial ribosome-associated GTPase 1-like [Pocillopora verrucosa]|uniref:mitochondrial ribosome-associated GTPase 1-like n=1 Tax=Pocillopora verrucosa TaxID=203993 RepID=UPI0027975A69|nr:mitochondrial ribosome-associated GTPase 1-like [Pocillopora verrucosa]